MHWRVVLGFCNVILTLWLALPGASAQQGFFNFNYPGPNTIIVSPPNCTNVLAGNIGTPTVSSTVGATITLSAFDPDTSHFQLTDPWNYGETAHLYWKVADNQGRVAWFEFFVSFVDTTRPVIVTNGLPPLVEYASIRLVPPPPVLTATDSCSPPLPVVTFSQTTPPALCQGGIFTRTWLATDLSGNTGVFTQTIVIQPDNAPPTVLTPPQNGAAPCTQVASAYPAWLAAQMANFKAGDPSGIAAYSNNAPPAITGDCPPPLTVTFTATDSCGYFVSRTAVFSVIDDKGPDVVSAPRDSVVYCTASDPNYLLALGDWISRRGRLTAKDSCTADQALSYSMQVNNADIDSAQVVAAFLASFASGCSEQQIGNQVFQKVHGLVSVDFYATDACGKSSLIGNADFGLIDTVPPQLSGNPATEECGGGNDQNALIAWINNHGNATATDVCSAFAWSNFSWNSSDGQSGTGQFNTGPFPQIAPNDCQWYTDVTFRATDDCGNTGAVTLRFFITDATPPVFAGLQATDTLFCPNTTPLPPTANVSDNCDAAPALSSTVQIIDPVCSDAYSLRVTWIATDDCGNTAAAVQTFIVFDTTKPVITLAPAPLTMRCDTFALPPAPVLGVHVTATDVCGDIANLSFSDVSNQNPDPATCGHYNYTIVRTFTVADDCGNTATTQQLITVVDNIPPQITGFADTTWVCDSQPLLPPPSATDVCSGIASPPALENQVISAGECPDSYTLTYNWTSTDVCGNTAYFSQDILIIDTVKPTLATVPGNIMVECNAIPVPPALSALGGSDNCDEEVSIVFSEMEVRDPNPANCAYWANYMIMRRWTVEDNCGNSRTYTQAISVQDNTGPEIVAQDTVKIPGETGLCGATAVVPSLISVFDDCTAQRGEITLQDTVGFTPNGSPVFDVPVDTVVFSWPAPNLPPGVPATGNATLTIYLDNADSKVPSETFEVWGEDGFHIGRTKLVGGFCGSSDTTFTLPASLLNTWLTDGQLTLTLSPNGQGAAACNAICPGNRARATLQYTVATQQLPLTVTCSIDNGPVLNYPPPGGFFLVPGDHTVVYTASDCAGNTSTASTIVRIEDLEPPMLTAPAPITAFVGSNNCLAEVVLPFPALSENCLFTADFNQSSTETPVQFVLDINSLQFIPKDITLTVTGLVPNAVSGGVLRIRHLGDNGNTGEFFNVFDEQNVFLSATTTSAGGQCSVIHETIIPVSAAQINSWATGNNSAAFILKANRDIVNFNDFINPCGPLDANNFDGASTGQAVLEYNYAVVNYEIRKGNTTVLSGQLNDSQTAVSLPPGNYTAHYSVSDNSGNVGATSFALTVRDTVPPQAKCQPLITIFTNLSGMVAYTLTPQELNNGSVDNCSGANLTFQLSQTTFNCNLATPPNNLYPVTLTVTDTSGNSASCTGTVQVRTTGFQPTYTPSNACEGATIQLLANPPQPTAGQTYLWSGPNGFVNTLPNPVISNASDAIYVVTVTGPTGCTSAATLAVDLSNLPTQPLFLPDVPSLICEGANLTLKCQQFPGTVVNYQWHSGTPASSTLLGITSVPLFTLNSPPPGTQQYFVRVIADGCASLPSLVKDITVQQRPVADIVQPLISICPCEPILLGAVAQTGASVSYVWNGPAGYTGSGQNVLANSCAQEINEGPYILTVSVNGCTSLPDTAMVTVRMKPSKPVISGNTLVCAGDSVLLVCMNEPTAAAYTWISPQTVDTVTFTNSLLLYPASASQAGLWRLRIVQDNCQSDLSDPIQVDVQSQPNISANSDSPVCQGEILQLSANSTASNVTYTWSGPNGYMAIGANQTVMVPATGTYTVTVSTNYNCTNTAEVPVSVVTPPVINAVTNNAPACTDCSTDAMLQATIFPANGSLTYRWTGPNGQVFSTLPQPVIPKVCTIHNGTYTLIVTDANGCISNQGSTEVNVQPEPPRPRLTPNPVISLCTDSAFVLTVQSTGAAYGSNISFEWHTPYGIFTQSQAQISIPKAGQQHSGDYWVVAKAGDCPSAPSEVVKVTVNAIPAAPVAGSNSAVCQGDVLSLTASAIPGATYVWTGPFNFSSSIQNPAIPQAAMVHAGEYKVRAIVNGCSSAEGTTVVVVKSRPPAPAVEVADSVCLSQPGATLTLQITGNATPMARYIWYNASTLDSLGPPAFPLSFQLTNLNGLKPPADSFFVRAVLDGCYSVPSKAVFVKTDTIPANIPAFAGPDFPACDQGPFALNATLPTGTTITGVWSKVGNGSAAITDPFNKNTWVSGGTAGNTYCFVWTLSNGACRNYSTDTVCATVNAFETAQLENTQIVTCFSDTVRLNAIQGQTVAGKWSQPPGQDALLIDIENPDDPNTIVSNLRPQGVHYFTWTLKTAGCPPSNATLTVLNIGKAADAGPDITVCSLDPCTVMMGSPIDTFERGKWYSLDFPPDQEFITPDDPQSKVCKLRIGVNRFMWMTNDGLCGSLSRDTVSVYYDLAPVANPDSVNVPYGQQVVINALQNDVTPTFPTVEVIQAPVHGAWNQTTPGTFTYLPATTFSGADELVYRLCNVNPDCDCRDATIRFIVGEAGDCRIPNIITPNNDGANDFFVIPPECLTSGDGPNDNEVTIFNQWGDQVYHKVGYDNSWNGSYDDREPLPSGTYYYVVKLPGNEKPVTGFLLIQR